VKTETFSPKLVGWDVSDTTLDAQTALAVSLAAKYPGCNVVVGFLYHSPRRRSLGIRFQQTVGFETPEYTHGFEPVFAARVEVQS
jgi:hypothetical protein